MPSVQRSVVIEVAVDQLFEIVEDFPRYPDFIPEMKRVTVLRKSGHSQDVEFELELELPLGMKKRIRYVLAFTEEKPGTVRWRLISGEYMKGNVGSWTFRSLGEARTEATYSIELSFGALVPKVVSNFLAEQSLPRMLAQFKQRAEGLAVKG